MAWDDNFWTGMIGEEYHYHVPIHQSFVIDNKCFIIPYLFQSECRIRFDNWPPHTRDFSRELGGFLLHFVCTYGII